MRLFIIRCFFYLVLYSVVLLISCQKENTTISNAPSNFSEVFNAFWNNMNLNYVYWDIDTTDWDAMSKKYKPVFAKLNLDDNNDVIKSVQYFQNMTKGLIDGHYQISFSNMAISYYSVNPSLERKQKLPNFHYQYSYLNIDTNYLDTNYILGYDNNNLFNGQPLTALCGTIENRIILFSCTEFSLLKSYKSTTANGVQLTLQYLFNELANLPANINGIIIDVRGNHGGDLGDLNFLVGHLVDKQLHFGYTQSKSGNGRLDFTPWIKAFVNPEPNAKAIKIPIVVLADLNSASLSEAVVMAIKSLPNGIFVGETTWGATGPVTETEVYNDGQFKIDNFLSVQTASCKFKYLDGKIYEGIGFPPDISVSFNPIAIRNGKDTQLEKAISLIPKSK
jgi:carboxyl-terminal processing protease